MHATIGASPRRAEKRNVRPRAALWPSLCEQGDMPKKPDTITIIWPMAKCLFLALEFSLSAHVQALLYFVSPHPPLFVFVLHALVFLDSFYYFPAAKAPRTVSI